MSPARGRALVTVSLATVAAAVGGCGARTPLSGRALFASHCELCHSIAGSASPPQQGGDLRGLRLPRSELLQYTVEMPTIGRRLTGAQARAVVAYMQALQRRR